MGGGAYSTNNRVNAAVARKAATRQPVNPLNSSFDRPDVFSSGFAPDPFVPTPVAPTPVETNPYAQYSAGDVETLFGDAGQKIGTNTYYDQKIYDSNGKVIDTRLQPKKYMWSDNKIAYENKAANPDFDIVNFYKSHREAADKNITGEATTKVLTQFDPNRGELARTTPTGYLLDQQVGKPFIEAIRDNKLSLTKKNDTPLELDYKYDYDANNLYMKQPPLLGNTNLQQGFTDEERDTYQDLMKRGSFIDVSGGTSAIGEYTMAWIEDPPKPSGFSKFLNNPVLSIIGALVPPIGIATVAAKAVTGETLHAGDWLSVGIPALDKLGVISAPVAGVADDVGTGIGGLNYAQTTGLLSSAATGNPLGAVMSVLPTDFVPSSLEKAGIVDQGGGKWNGIQIDDLTAGVTKAISKAATGADVKTSLASGFGEYIREGGTLGSYSLPDFSGGNFPDLPDLGIIEDVVREVGRKTEDVVRAVGSVIDDGVLQPIKNAAPEGLEEIVKDAGRAAEDVVRAGGSAIDDAVIQPVREVAKVVDDAILQPIGDKASELDTALREFLPKVEDVVREAVNPLDDWISDVQSPFSTPDIDLPSIDLPNIDLPNFNLPSLGMGMGMLLSGSPAPTATTGKLFENELFKFKNKIELTEFGPLNQPEQEVDIEEFLTSPFESAFTTTQRFA